MAQAEISPAANYPPGCTGPPDSRLSDAVADLRRMLAPLDDLPELAFAVPLVELTELPEVIDVTLELQLDADRPHLDFIDHLLRMLQRIVAARGVIFEREQLVLLAATQGQAQRTRQRYDAARGSLP